MKTIFSFLMIMAIGLISFATCPREAPTKHYADSHCIVKTEVSTTIVSEVYAYQLSFDHSPFTASISPTISINRKYWVVPLSIGTPDTKRHFAWKAEIIKLC